MDGARRDPWLDALRGAAVLLVLGRHLNLPAGADPALAAWQRGGWVGVDLFFVLSGFLVSGLLFREYQRRRTLSPARFLLRRALRLYPAFLILLLATAMIAASFGVPRAGIRGLLVEACFIQNYGRGVWNHTWSLAVEEHFYLALPALLLVLVWRGRGTADPFRALLPLTAIVAAGELVLRCVLTTWLPYSHRSYLFPTHLRTDALLAGVALAYLDSFHRAALDRIVVGRRVLLLATGAACFAPAFVLEASDRFIHTGGLSLHAVGAALLIAGGVRRPVARPLTLLAAVGRNSYSIYLWHMPVLVWIVPALARAREVPADLQTASYLLGSLLTGLLMARLTERPFLRLRERWLGGDATPKGPQQPHTSRAIDASRSQPQAVG